MQIAAVAYDHLDPAVPARVDALIKLNPDYAKWIGGVADAGRDRFAFVRASTWADDIKDDIKGEDGYHRLGRYPDPPQRAVRAGQRRRSLVIEPLAGRSKRRPADSLMGARRL